MSRLKVLVGRGGGLWTPFILVYTNPKNLSLGPRPGFSSWSPGAVTHIERGINKKSYLLNKDENKTKMNII